MVVTTFIPLNVDILRSTLFVLQNSWHFQMLKEYGRIYFICTATLLTFLDNGVIFNLKFELQNLWHLIFLDVEEICKIYFNDFWVLEELDDHGILVKFFKDLITSRKRWLRNSYEILQGFRAEFWWPALVSNNSNDYQIHQKVDDLRIFIKFSLDFDQNSVLRIRKLDDHGILVKFFND